MQNSFRGFEDYIVNFADTHEESRFLNLRRDFQKYRSYLAYILCACRIYCIEGIPMLYYAAEQNYEGNRQGEYYYNREILWYTFNQF